MDCQGKILLNVVLLLFTVACGSVVSAQNASDQEKPYCSASEEYLEKHNALNRQNYSLNKDFACLVDLATLRDDPTSYQKIDIRPKSSASDEIDGAWRMTVRELRSNRTLKNRPILLLGPSFSRIEAARHCSSLKKAGFTDVKVLVGGAEAWITENQKRYQNPFGAAKTVTAREFLYEYFNGNVVLIAANTHLAHELTSLGLRDEIYVASAGDLSVEEIIADKSGGGYYPVVYVGNISSISFENPERVSNLYFLEGSTSSIARELTKNQWINANRKSIPRRYRCG